MAAGEQATDTTDTSTDSSTEVVPTFVDSTGQAHGPGLISGSHASVGLTPRQQERVEKAIDSCRTENGLDVSVFLGDLTLQEGQDFRAAAEQVHAGLGERAATAVLVLVAPGQRRMEVVTGPRVRRRVPDRVASLAVVSATSSFSGGDLVGGIVDALRQMSTSAGPGEPLPPMANAQLEAASSTELTHH